MTRLAWACSGNRRPSASSAGSSGLSPAAIESDSPGRIRTTRASGPAGPAAPASRAAISRYSALAGSTTSHGIPALAAASSMARTVCDLPEPAAPLTSTCRCSEPSGSASEAGLRYRSRMAPTAMRLRAGPALLGDVELGPHRQPDPGHLALGRPGQRGEQPGARVERMRRHGVAPGRDRALVVQDLPQARPGRQAGPPAGTPRPGRRRPGPGRTAARPGRPRRTPARPPATRPPASAPPASSRTRHHPADRPARTSAWRRLSRRPATARSGKRSRSSAACRSSRASSSATSPVSAGLSGSATSSQPNGPGHTASRHSSSVGGSWPAIRGAPPASRPPASRPPASRPQ